MANPEGSLDYEIQRLKVLLERAGYEVTIKKKAPPINVSISLELGTNFKAFADALAKLNEAARLTTEDFARLGRAVAGHRE